MLDIEGEFGSGATSPEGIGLCLSGGGYRAMLFHAGCIRRLFEAGLLQKVVRVSSVSGGSIAAGVLARCWGVLTNSPHRFAELFTDPIQRLASQTIDRNSIMTGILLPGTIAQHLADAYDEDLFEGATLQDLPDSPKFIFNSTNLETGSLFRFSKRYARDYRVGGINNPTFRLAEVVAASSAFPPVLSPFVLEVEPGDFDQSENSLPDDFRRQISLSDGGVYDNLGLETVWKNCATVLVSDGGARIADDSSPAGDWASQSKRILDVIDHQVRSLRKRHLIASFVEGERSGAYWGIRTGIADYQLPDALPCPLEASRKLSEVPTRLKRLPARTQEQLINWGYAVCDAAIRKHVDGAIPAAASFPYPEAGI